MASVGPFELLGLHERGGMGEVWRALHQGTGLPVAVKLVPAEAGPHLGQLLRREVEVHAALVHPNIAEVLDAGTVTGEEADRSGGVLVGGRPWLAVAWAAGGTLADWRGRLAPRALVSALLQVLDALAHAHASGVLHLDVKPENVLVTAPATWHVCLTDFGISERLATGAATRSGGTLHFAPPEQVATRWREYGPATDLFALGRTAAAVAGSALPTWPELAGWVDRLVEPHPADRWSHAADARQALLSVGSPPPGWSTRFAPASVPSTPTMALDPGLATTVSTLWSGGAEERSPDPAAPDDPPRAVRRATSPAVPFPSRWEAEVPEPSMARIAAGLGLFGFRPAPFVGKRAERDRLWEDLSVARGGGTRLVVLHGRPGSGRSALAVWLCGRASELGVASALRLEPGMEPVAALARAVVQVARGEGLVGPELERRVRAWALGHAIDPDALLSLLRPGVSERAAARAVAALGRARPVVLSITDEGESSRAIRLAAALHAAGADALVLVEAGTAAVPPTSLPPARIRVLEISPPDTDETARLVDQLLPLEPDVRVRVVALAEGRPAVAREIVRAWVRADALVLRPEGFAPREGAAWPEPSEALAEAVRAVCGGPGGVEGRLAAVAAALGSAPDPAEWQQACAAEGCDPLSVASRLVAAGLARWEGDGWRWEPGAAEAVLEAGDRPAAHRAALALVVAVGGDPMRVAIHAALGDADDAVALCTVALQNLGGLWGWTPLRDRIHAAVARLLDRLPPDDGRRADLQLLRIVAHLSAAELPPAGRGAAELLEESELRGWDRHRMRALQVLGRVATYEGDPRAIGRLRQALSLAEGLGQELPLAQISEDLAFAERTFGPPDLAALAFREVERRFGALGRSSTLTREGLVDLLARTGSVDEARARFDRLEPSVGVTVLSGIVALAEGHRAWALERFRAAEAQADADGLLAWLARLYLAGHGGYADPEDARRALGGAARWASHRGFGEIELAALVGLAALAGADGDLDLLRATLREVEVRLRGWDDGFEVRLSVLALRDVLASSGEPIPPWLGARLAAWAEDPERVPATARWWPER